MLAGELTTIAAALFTGAAVYINVAEQPARQALETAAMLAQWRASYPRAARMQASLALIGGALGALAAFQQGDTRWLWAAALLLANWPYTLICVKPINDALARLASPEAAASARGLVASWGRLHAGRSALGVAAVLVCLWAAQ
jgi:anthrone oxygenase-like protein